MDEEGNPEIKQAERKVGPHVGKRKKNSPCVVRWNKPSNAVSGIKKIQEVGVREMKKFCPSIAGTLSNLEITGKSNDLAKALAWDP